jgi:hypothetical protein
MGGRCSLGGQMAARLGAVIQESDERSRHRSKAVIPSPRSAHIRPRPFDLRPHDALFCVIVDEPHRLHEGIDGGRTDELLAAPAQRLRQSFRGRRG